MPDEKEPIPKFAARIKAKYPEYKDVDDTLLTQRIVEKYPEYGAMVDMGGIAQPVKKKESALGGTGGGGLSPSGDEPVNLYSYKALLPKPEEDKNRFVKKPLPLPKAIEADKKKKDSVVGGVYNTIVGSVARLAGGFMETQNVILNAGEAALGKMMGTPGMNYRSPVMMKVPERKETVDFIEKARTASSSKENEQARSQFDITNGVQASDVKALLFQAPSTIVDMVGGAYSGGTSFFFQSVNDNAQELEENPNAAKLTNNEKLGYLFVQGTVQAALEKFGIDKILKSTGLSSKVKQKIANEVTDEFIKKGIKATGKDIEAAVLRRVSSLPSQIKRVGAKTATSFAAEGGTEGLQQAASDGVKLLTNKISGSEVFDEEDIAANFIKNTINAAAQGGVFGGGIGGTVGVLSSTKKAIRNEIANATTPEDIQKMQANIAEQVELGNITPEEAEAANITAQQYAEVAATIPQEIDADKKYALIGGIEQREEIKNGISEAQAEMSKIDPAFHEDIQARVELLNAKLAQTNDYIDGIATGKKPTYRKEGDVYIKTDSKGETPISKEHYELATAVREEDAANNKQAEEISKQEIKAAKILAKSTLPETYQVMAEENPIGVVKDIAKQAQNLNEEFEPHNDGKEEQSLQRAKEVFGEEAVSEAIKLYPKAEPTVPMETQPEGAAEGVAPSILDLRQRYIDDFNIVEDSAYDWRVTSSLSGKDRKKAVEDIKAGRETTATKKLEAEIAETIESGYVKINRGRGSHSMVDRIPVNEWFGLNTKEQNASLELNDFTTSIINDNDITLQNVDDLKDLFNGFPYEQEDFDNIKTYLTEQGQGDAQTKPISESGEAQKAVNEKAETTPILNTPEATGAATGTPIEAGKEAKKPNRKALSDELRSLLGGTVSEGLPFKDVSNKDIKEGDSKSIEEYNQRAERVLKTLYPNAEFKAFNTTKEYEQATGRKNEAGVLIRGKEGKHQLFLNLEAIINSDIERTATHEVVHALVSDAIGVKYADLRKKWDNLLPKLYGVKGFEIVKEHIEKYSSADRPVEGITDLLANVVHGKIKIEDVPKNLWDEFIELVNRAFEAIGVDYKITPDTFNGFALSVKEAFETGDFSSLKKFTSKSKTEKFFNKHPEFAESASAMADPEKRKKLINDFIKSSFEKGASEEDIKGALIDNGLTETEAQSFIDSNKPPKAPDETEDEFQNKPKSILNRLFNSNNVSQKVKNDFEKEGLTYEPQSHEQARRIAGEIISEFGVENSITMAESGRFSGDVNSMIFAEGIDRTFHFEQAVSSVDEKIELAEQWADYAIRYDKAARESGRFISAIYDFYRKSPLGVIISERRKREEAFKDWFDKREKPYKEVFDALQEEPDFKEMLKAKVETQLKQERAVFRMKRRKKISDLFDGAKIGNQGINSSIIPPQIWNAAVEVMKQATLAGESIASVIETGVKYIKENNKDAWDEKAFRNEWTEKLDGVDKEGKVELTSEEKKQRILDRFRKKLKGLSEEQKEDVIRKSFKKLVEAGALEYDDFKKIVADVIGLGELTAEETAKMTGFIKDMNAVQDLSDALIKNESKEALKAFESGVKKAEESATKLAAMLYTKPKVAQRLRSIIQLNTLGVVSLIKNPFYNIFHQMLVRLPKGIVMTILDQAIYGASVLGNKAFGSPIIKPDVNILLAQRGYFGKGAKGGAEAVKQVFTGLTNKDYFQKEVYNSQIKPFSSWRDLWAWGKGKKNLSKGQIADKALQGTFGIPAEAVARMLNIGDKPFRFAAEAAIAKTIGQQQLGLNGFELDVFMRLPKEKAKQIFIKKGFTEDQANKKAEEIEKRIVAEGEEAVFQQNNIVADVINKVKQALPTGEDGHPLSSIGSGAAKLFGLLNMPFVKTPANIAWEVFNLVNPEFALGQALVYGVRAARTNSKADFLRAKKWMAHAATGWALLGAAGYLASIGAVSGDDEDEPYKPKESKGKGTYEKPHSVNLSKLIRGISGDSIDTEDDDLNVDLSWFGAMGMIMNMQANKFENMSKEERENLTYTDDILFRLNRGAQDGLVNSVFSGSLTAVDALRSGRHDQWLLGMGNVGMNAIEPATIAQLSRATRPYDYKITGDDLSETFMNNLKSRTFGVIGNPKSKVNVWGEPMKREGTASDVTLRMLGISKSDTDKFATPLFEEFKKTGNPNFFPPAISPKITVDGEERRLNAEQLLQYETLVGQSRRNLVDPFINNAATIKGKRYNKMNEEQKIEALKSLYSKGYNSGKKIFIQLHPEFKSKK